MIEEQVILKPETYLELINRPTKEAYNDLNDKIRKEKFKAELFGEFLELTTWRLCNVQSPNTQLKDIFLEFLKSKGVDINSLL